MGDIEDIFRAFLGSVCIIGIMFCMVFCLYKYAVCQENNGKPIIPINNVNQITHKSKNTNVINNTYKTNSNIPRTYPPNYVPNNSPFIVVVN